MGQLFSGRSAAGNEVYKNDNLWLLHSRSFMALSLCDQCIIMAPRHSAYDIQNNDTQHNDIQNNDTQHNDIQNNDTQNNDTQHNDK